MGRGQFPRHLPLEGPETTLTRALGIGLLLLGLTARPAAAQSSVVLDQVLGSWQGNDAVQFVELRMLAAGQNRLSQGAQLVFDDATGAAATRTFFTFTQDVAQGVAGGRVLIATAAFAQVAGLQPDYVVDPGRLAPHAGRVCYQVVAQGQVVTRDCVAYGPFQGAVLGFGPPTSITPDDRALVRVATTGQNQADWTGALSPMPVNDAGQTPATPLATLCGNGEIDQGEQCDGTALGGRTCASLGLAKGTLACTQCHFDASRCTACGNGAINPGEQCDGNDLGGRSCASLGFTGGTLACTPRCRLSTAGCDPTFFVPGGGPAASACLAEWRVTNAGGRPGADGKASPRQRCREGDSGCDAGTAAGACTFTVALCVDHADARLARCRPRPITSVAVLQPKGTAGGADAELAARLLAAAGALGPSSASGARVAFAPPLAAVEHCTAPLPLVVATKGRRPGARLLRVRAAAAAGRAGSGVLKLVCAP